MLPKEPTTTIFLRSQKENLWVWDVRTSWPGKYQIRISKKPSVVNRNFPSSRVISEFASENQSLNYLWEICSLEEGVHLAFASSFLPDQKKISNWFASNIALKDKYMKKLASHDFHFAHAPRPVRRFFSKSFLLSPRFAFYLFLIGLTAAGIYAIVSLFT